MAEVSTPTANVSDSLDLSGKRIGVLLNTSSGSCDVKAQEDVQALLQAAGLEATKIWCGGGSEVDAALGETKAQGLDILIVVGGDGTIRAAAETCDTDGPLLVPLPGGTMNMLPKALYGNRPWREALRETLAAPSVQAVHGGMVEGRRFFTAALFGGPTRIAEAREAVRDGDIVAAIDKGASALMHALSSQLDYQLGNKSGRAETVAVLCPLTSRRLDPDEEVLEVAAIKVEGALDAFRLALRAAFEDWRNDPTVDRVKLRRFEISSDEPIPALLDGETFILQRTVSVELLAQAFMALRPAGDQ